MARLKEDFPGFTELDAAGEATEAKIRKRIKDGTLREIPGIGEAREREIIEAFEAMDTPADQAKRITEAEDDDTITPASQAKALQDAESAETADGDGETLLTEGAPNDAALEAGEHEAQKSGVERNQLPGHDLAELSPKERREAGVRESTAERIAHSGAVYIHDPAGPYASRTAVRIPQGAIRIKVEPIGLVPPQKGMNVKDGDDEYAIQEAIGPDATGDDWLKIRSPNTGLAFIR